MANITKELASFENGNCVWTITYDDVSLLLTNISCTNNSSAPTRGTATVQKNGRTVSALVNANGDTLNRNIPTNQANRLELTVDARGRPDGIDYNIVWGPDTI
jgi:hypothetical protein